AEDQLLLDPVDRAHVVSEHCSNGTIVGSMRAPADPGSGRVTDRPAAIARWIRVDADALAERTAAALAGSELVLALHGDTAALHDAIAGRPGDFDRLLA